MAAWLRFLAVLLLGSAFWPPAAVAWWGDSAAAVAAAELPPEARNTLALIKRGGPYPYSKDGTVFGNFERRLPAKPRGYYHEYTVKTPGSRDRGPRRIIAGGDPAATAEFYYTQDHYRTFRRIEE
ncbi:MAG: ribonuclease [Rhodocyclaceae bacterium]|nr:ribonuclease [Rhodocyclaceae bacterium]